MTNDEISQAVCKARGEMPEEADVFQALGLEWIEPERRI